MGHQVLKCGYCGAHVMEGHNDWECDCGAVCDNSTKYKWIKDKKDKKKKEQKKK